MIVDLVRESLAQVPDSARKADLDEVALLAARDLDELADEPTADELALALPGVLYHSVEAIRLLRNEAGYGNTAVTIYGAVGGFCADLEKDRG